MCTVQILSVHGVAPPGAVAPTQLRVTGRLLNCPTDQVALTSTVAAGVTVAADPVTGRFTATLPITASNVVCGTSVDVSAHCVGTPTCQTTQTEALRCCEIGSIMVQGNVAPGALAPTALLVVGVARGCYGNSVVVSTPVTGASAPVSVDPWSGAFSVALPITGTARCDGTVKVTVTCDATCSGDVEARIVCSQCMRAQLSYSAAACTGSPPTQPITLDATISIAAGAQQYFRWDYGDGVLGPVFLIDNTAGTANTPHAHTESHNYSPGGYFARLIATNAGGNPLECDPILLPVNASCSTGPCPTVTVTAGPPGPCVNGARSVTYQATVTGASGVVVLQWSFPNSNTPSTTAFLLSGPVPSQTVSYVATSSPVTQTATLQVISPMGCPSGSASVTILPCPSCCPTISIAPPVVTGCAPASAAVAFSASVNWPSGCGPTPPGTTYAWTLNGAGGKQYQITTTAPNVSTGVPWIESATNTPATPQFSLGGSYSIAVTATLPSGAGGTCQPATGTLPFTVPPCCPQLIGPLNVSADPADACCTWLFSAQVSNPSGAPVTYEWTFHDGTTAQTAVPQVKHTYPVGSITTGTTTVTLKSPGCPNTTLSVIVTHCCFPGGTTTTTTSTTTTSTTTTTTSTTTTSPPPSGGMGCLCILLLVLAMALLVISGVSLVMWGCTGMLSAALLTTAITTGIGGLLVLLLWIVLCRACAAIRFLAGFFGVLSTVFFVTAAILLLFGQLGCAVGSLAAGGLFAAAAAILGLGARLLRCP